MKLYHRTFEGEEILRDGFKDSTGTWGTEVLSTGVWFSDRALDENEGGAGNAVMVIDIPEHKISDYEWIQRGLDYREWLVPAALADQYLVGTIFL